MKKISQINTEEYFILSKTDEDAYDQIYNAIDEIKSIVYKTKKVPAICMVHEDWLQFAAHLEKLRVLVDYYNEFDDTEIKK